MLKSCNICGKIHPIGMKCPQKKCKKDTQAEAYKFRSSSAWKNKREEIKKRDCYCCRCCFEKNKELTNKKINQNRLSVHHIEPLDEAMEKALDDDNLICLCDKCHELAEKGKIDKKFLKKLAASPPVL